MSALRAGLVQGASLAVVAKELGLDAALQVGGHLRRSRGRAGRGMYSSVSRRWSARSFWIRGGKRPGTVIRALDAPLADPDGRLPET
ncbi:MAG: hypothetical protein M5U09_28145 [Gammaproteobacteria bacterium]|nr:hypothetical protein [Gammaproteobacteria bacterium]